MREVLNNQNQEAGEQDQADLADHVQIDPHITMHMLSPAGSKQAYQPRYAGDVGQGRGEEGLQGEYPYPASASQALPLADQMDAIEKHTDGILKQQGLRPTP